MPLLELKDVWKVYGTESKTYALRGVDLKIEEGEFVAIMGPSGSGKSTLLHILGLLDTPTRGKVYVKGNDVSGFSEEELAILRRKFVGFVFQSFNLIPSLTALENVELPLIFAGVPEEERKERAESLLSRLGLSHRLHHYPNQLSGGQQQRVAIARALVNNPEVILADEPTGNLDSKSGEEVMALLNELHREGRTLIVVTHDPEVARYAERVVRIRDGRVVE